MWISSEQRVFFSIKPIFFPHYQQGKLLKEHVIADFLFFFLLFRKGALLVNNIIAIVASILMGISFPTGLFELLIVGRFLIGINSGELFSIPTFNNLW